MIRTWLALTTLLLMNIDKVVAREPEIGWYTTACGFVPAVAVPSVPAESKDWQAPPCCYVSMKTPDEMALAVCLQRGWREVNGVWVAPPRKQ